MKLDTFDKVIKIYVTNSSMMLLAILYILLGIIIKYGKMYFLLAGYNTMSKEEQEKIDIERVATLFRNVMFIMAAILLAAFFIFRLTDNQEHENLVSIAVSLAGVVYLIVLANSNKYRKES